ncbi:hypothetical protein Tco_1027733 [Tanacetum coccineum]
MVESSNPTQIPSSPDVTPKEEPITLDRPESPNPFLPADQVEFNFDQISFTTKNEVALLYPEHPNFKYFQIVSDFISKCCLKEAFTRAPNQYKEYRFEFFLMVDSNTFGQEMVNILVSGEAYDKVLNHLHAPLEGKVLILTTAKLLLLLLVKVSTA